MCGWNPVWLKWTSGGQMVDHDCPNTLAVIHREKINSELQHSAPCCYSGQKGLSIEETDLVRNGHLHVKIPSAIYISLQGPFTPLQKQVTPTMQTWLVLGLRPNGHEHSAAERLLSQRTNDHKYQVRLIAAKSRVTPLKQLSVLRLELQAAVLASRLAKTIEHESRLQFKSVKLFTDSSITLAWLQSPSHSFKPFVSSRVGEIQSNTDQNQWRHFPGEVNVADDVSRGIPVEELNGQWSNGPEFLQLPEEFWPQETTKAVSEDDMERRQVKAVYEVKKGDLVNHQKRSWYRTDARNEKSMSKIWMWPSLSLLNLRSECLWLLEFLKNLKIFVIF